MTKRYAVAMPLLTIWLAGWIAMTWGAVQDDSFIHLRYASNLLAHHSVTYDGVHANYGASSLLFVWMLASLRAFSASPDLAHAVSSAFHVLLFAGLGVGFWRRSGGAWRADDAPGLILLMMLCTPSAVRWLDDGMETGLAVAVACVFAWLIQQERDASRRSWPNTARTWQRSSALVTLSFAAVLLRVELLLLCGLGCLIVFVRASPSMHERVLRSRPFVLGSGLAVGTILVTMHALLPDTAAAKSHGTAHWFHALHDSASTLAGAMSFGAGMLVFWLLTLTVAVRRAGWTPAMVAANSAFPLLLIVAMLRGQEIQGARYFAWTFFFSSVWNILEGTRERASKTSVKRALTPNTKLVYGFMGLLVAVLPVEAVTMHPVLRGRQETMRVFESQRLEVLQSRRGVAFDIGFVGYFTRASLCDLAGLVNGREVVRLSSVERTRECLAVPPDFVFLNAGQLNDVAKMADFSQWQVCGHYDFTNVSAPDRHYLIVRPGIAEEVCRATAMAPVAAGPLLPAVDVARSPPSL